MVYYFYHLDYKMPPQYMIEDGETIYPSVDIVKEEVIDQINSHDIEDDVMASRPYHSELFVHAKV